MSQLTAAQKQQIATAVCKFMDAVELLVGPKNVSFRRLIGIGTDGTCWSDAEHRKNALNVAEKALAALKKEKGQS